MREVVKKDGKELPLMESYYTLQGEGYHTGKATYFVRLAGCDVHCKWCDTMDSWRHDKYPYIKTDEIVDKIMISKTDTVVVTGGEPLIHNLDYLCGELKERNIMRYLETSGSEHITGMWDWICLSPKTASPPKEE